MLQLTVFTGTERPQQHAWSEDAIRFCDPVVVFLAERRSTEGEEERNSKILVRPKYVQVVYLVARRRWVVELSSDRRGLWGLPSRLPSMGMPRPVLHCPWDDERD